MAENERQQLRKYVSAVEEWNAERQITSLEVTFFYLAELDPGRNEDLWEDLRIALRDNEALRDTGVRFYLSSEEMAEQGYWWFDPESWAARVSA